MVSHHCCKADTFSKSDTIADELLLRMQKIQAIKRPTERSQSNLSNLISNTQSLVADESDWIRCGPDLAALGRDSEHGWLNSFLDDILNKVSMRFTMASVPCLADTKCFPHPSTQIHPCYHPSWSLSYALFLPATLPSIALTNSFRVSSVVMSRSSRLGTKISNFSPRNVWTSSFGSCSRS